MSCVSYHMNVYYNYIRQVSGTYKAYSRKYIRFFNIAGNISIYRVQLGRVKIRKS